MTTTAARRTLDDRALARAVQRLRAGAPPWLHEEAARRMAERLPIVKLQPEVVLDWWPRLGGGGGVLRRAYPKAHVIAVEPEAPPKPPWWARARRPEAAAEATLTRGAAQLVWSNMALHAVADPPALIGRWRDALAVGGFLMFSTLGPGTLESLSKLYAQAGWAPPFAPFVDMHDLGDMLVEAGFADPVMDQETLTLTWPDAARALAELRTLGANVDPRRHAGLRTPRWRTRLLDALAGSAGADGRPRLAFELVYGHAFKAAPRARVQGETALPLDDLKSMLRTGRAPR
jgi:malonyl-CoA O-methyltransferase